MRTTLVINPKGGSGKTTIAVNLATALAAEGIPTTLMDYDPQRSSLAWLASRPPHAPRIYGANGAPAKFRQLRSFEMYVPAATRHLIIDSPAGASGALSSSTPLFGRRRTSPCRARWSIAARTGVRETLRRRAALFSFSQAPA